LKNENLGRRKEKKLKEEISKEIQEAITGQPPAPSSSGGIVGGYILINVRGGPVARFLNNIEGNHRDCPYGTGFNHATHVLRRSDP
jgi:hypothetical protein